MTLREVLDVYEERHGRIDNDDYEEEDYMEGEVSYIEFALQSGIS